MKIKKDRGKYLYYLIAIGCLILFLLILLSSIIDLGEKLRRISIYLEIGFYVLVVLLIYFVIINPILIIVRSPSLSIVTTMDKKDSRAIAIYKKVAKNEELLFNLNYVFDKTVKKQLNSIILSNAKVVMISTAICQNARIDMLTVFAINLKMIKQLVQKCGFRPSMKNLSKLTINVFSTALIAEGLENLNLDDIVPKSAMNVIGDIPMLGKVLESITQGAANALLTIRIGCVCRRFLFTDGSVITQEDIRRQAYKETLKLLPIVMAETVSFFPKRIVKFFSKAKTNNVEEVLEGAK